MDFHICSMWNGCALAHDAMTLKVEPINSDNCVKIVVTGKFFNDPPAPSANPGPTDLLWDYEVVEAFFLNSRDNTYLEVEFGPHGHQIVLLLQGRRNIIKKLLPLTYTANISTDRKTWTGEALVPLDYFPPNVDMFNAFAIHGSDPNRHYEQLYPQKDPVTQPDFHRLDDFEAIDFTNIIAGNQQREYSAIWKENMTPVK